MAQACSAVDTQVCTAVHLYCSSPKPLCFLSSTARCLSKHCSNDIVSIITFGLISDRALAAMIASQPNAARSTRAGAFTTSWRLVTRARPLPRCKASLCCWCHGGRGRDFGWWWPSRHSSSSSSVACSIPTVAGCRRGRCGMGVARCKPR